MEQKTKVSKRIFNFYRWGLRIVPLLLMLAHWVYVYISNNLPETHNCTGMTIHTVPLYVMAYVFPLAFMLPASYFFRLCTIWRIPFLYLVGVNALHLYNSSVVCTPQIAGQCEVLICVVLVTYAIAIVRKIQHQEV